MQMGYYNSYLALWEPLIEPVEVEKDGKLTYVPWELKVEVKKIIHPLSTAQVIF